ncbi:hypothetical protein HYW83_04310 [Candidatus Peregrinibacteria bacterium]|nr:hypothetical protein [Candidatus Peregrinibacteria bacterium]
MNFQQTLQAPTNRFYEDPSFWSLLAANGITIALAFSQQWDFFTIAWIYWSQSVIIGIFNFFRILNLEKFSTENLRINGKFVQPTPKVKHSVALFFLLHYNGFHLGYLMFLVTKGNVDFNDIWIPAAIFLINHFFSFRSNAPKEKNVGRNIGSILFFPYVRIVPMHLTLIFLSMAGTAFGLAAFFILKTLADLFMHIVEHRWWQNSQPVS